MSETGHQVVAQTEFTETPYADAEWEIIGQPPTEQTFTPAQVEVLTVQAKADDPLFADYGGYGSQKGKQIRWHLPEELAASHIGTPEAEESRLERMVEEHTAALAAMEKRAIESGRKIAAAEFEKAHEEKLKAINDRVSSVLSDLRKQLDERRDAIERQAVDLAIAIASQLTRATVEYNPEYILPIIKQGLDQAGGAVVRCVKVSKEDLEFLNLAGSLTGIEGAGTTWQFVEDESIKSGCVVETANGEIDLQIDAAFERVKDQVLKAVR